jgi:ribonucleoside-diphosphate reductase alpha chain
MGSGSETAAEQLGFPEHWPPLAVRVWDQKYRLKRADGSPLEATWSATVARVARAAARAEAKPDRARWTAAFADCMRAFEFLPAGRILAGAGAKRHVTLFNCFVMGRIKDDLSSIFDHVREAALTMQQGGGIGHDFSTLRPAGALVAGIGADASGPVTFMDVWDAMCRTIMSAGHRRGAMMATLRCDHPDIETFIDAKRTPGRLRNFNLSVLVTDAFVAAVRADDPWDLVFSGRVYRTVRARDLWDRIMRATYDVAEPGVIFIDRVNAANNLAYCETIEATNPCGEQPLPPYGACLLGSLNLAVLVRDPFTPKAAFDDTRLGDLTATAVRFLDNVIDVSRYPLEAQRAEAKAKRRIGLGVTGLADALIQLSVRYGSAEAVALTERWLGAIKVAAYRTSAELAAGKGAFPRCDREALLARPGLADLPAEVRSAIARHGLRNGLLTSIAPTGTISLLAGNVSSGIEPVFDFRYERRVLQSDGSAATEPVEDYAHALARRLGRSTSSAAFVTTQTLAPADHLAMQAAAQRHVDSAISKTVNCPEDIAFDAFKDIYLDAYARGLKGCTTYRPNAITGSVLATAPAAQAAPAAPPAPTSPPRPPAIVGDVVYMTEPLARDPILAGYTYKLRWPGSDHALYITLNDVESGGRRRPFEIFINSKNLEHYAWTLALTRMISAIFRRGGDVSFVVGELKAVFDPRGGTWIDGRYVPSLLAAIGDVIELHLRRIGFLIDEATPGDPARAAAAVAAGSKAARPASGGTLIVSGAAPPPTCPRCSSPTWVKQEGCWRCTTCGHSTCT